MRLCSPLNKESCYCGGCFVNSCAILMPSSVGTYLPELPKNSVLYSTNPSASSCLRVHRVFHWEKFLTSMSTSAFDRPFLLFERVIRTATIELDAAMFLIILSCCFSSVGQDQIPFTLMVRLTDLIKSITWLKAFHDHINGFWFMRSKEVQTGAVMIIYGDGM